MEKVKLPVQRIEAQFAAAEGDKESRTVPMTFYSGAKVLQFNWEKGLHYLQLSMEPKAVRLGLLNSGNAPFTRGHAGTNDPDAVIGIVSNARIEGSKARADVRFSKRADVEPLYGDVMDGILRNVSVEASFYKLKETTKEGDKLRSFFAEDWEPTAVALVAQGADAKAHINAAVEQFTECEIEFCEFAGRASAQEEQHGPELGVATRLREIEIARLRI